MLGTLVRIPFMLRERRHWRTIVRFAFVYNAPLNFLRRYTTKSGSYPTMLTVRVGGKAVRLHLFHAGDLDTANQIFCRNDYPAKSSDRIFVDIGANIGLTTRYFCEVSENARVFSFEPSPENIAKFKINTAAVQDRVSLKEIAVSDYNGTAKFVTEPVGRYSHLADSGTTSESTITVSVVDAAKAIDEILEVSGYIDVLKIDIEGTEERVLNCLRPDQLRRIRRIFAEYSGPLVPAGFDRSRWGHVSHFANREFRAP